MIYYCYELRWKNYEKFVSGEEELFYRHGRPESLYSIYSDMTLGAMNEELYAEFQKNNRYVLCVTQRLDTELTVYAAVSIECADSFIWEEKLAECFPDCEVINKREVTIGEFRNEISVKRIGGLGKILEKLNLKRYNSMFDPLPFRETESVPKYQKLSKAKCKARAKAILGSKSLYEELDRIYSKENRKEYFGHPVHYVVSAGDWGAARDICDLLLEALYSNGRLLSCRQCEFRDIRKQAYKDERYKYSLEAAEGGVVIVEMKTEDDMGRFASAFHDFTKFMGQMLEQRKKDTLFIFVEITGKFLKGSEAMSNILNKADIIRITEGSGTREDAAKYLLELARKVEFEADNISDASEYLPDAEHFSVTDIFNAYNSWYGSGLKNHVYKAYKTQKTFKPEAVRDDHGKPYDELQSLIGLHEAKVLIDRIISANKLFKVRERMGLCTVGTSRHMLFSGSPGTAKTTVARLIAQVLKEEDILSSGRFVECGRQDLVGKYVGWTAHIVEEKFKEAQGGVLFIDEAYSLVDDSRSYGDEAINTIIQLMENYRSDVIVIFAGYTDKMKQLLDRNEGLRSRIAFHLDFPDYSPDELTDILALMVSKRDYTIDDDALELCRGIFDDAVTYENFGNGRYVRNLLEQAMLCQADRIISGSVERELSKEELCCLKKEDFRSLALGTKAHDSRIGFVS